MVNNSIDKSGIYHSVVHELNSEIEENMKKYSISGLTIGLVTATDAIWIKGFGYTDWNKSQKVDENTLVGLQSTTKTFTAIAFLRAVQLGYVKLDDPLKKYYPDFSVKSRFEEDYSNQITFRHLLSHQSGLTCEAYYGGVFDNTDLSFEDHIKSVTNTWLEYPPGERLSYSNIGMDLVTYVLQLIIGKTYPEFITKHVLNPLGIKSMVFESKDAFQNINSFKGYVGQYKAKFHNISNYGCGSGFISARDLVKFVRFLLNKGITDDGVQLIESSLMEGMLSGEDGSYGFGVFISNFGQVRAYNHAGGGFGYNSEMYWVPEYKIGVITQSNQEYQPYTNELAKKAIRMMLKAQGVEIKERKDQDYSNRVKTIGKSKLKRYVGYYSGLVGSNQIIMKNDKLFLLMSGKEIELKGLSETEFTSEEVNYIRFELDENGKCRKIKFHYSIWGHIIYDYLGREVESSYLLSNEIKNEYIGLYRYNYYENEENYIGINYIDGFLYKNKTKLFRYQPNIFYDLKGEVFEFFENEMRMGGIKAVKINDPVEYFTTIHRKDPKSRYLQAYVLDSVAGILESLGRTEEGKNIKTLKEL
jgi:CubicO group peptidase (beta-lactamase class C family)